MVRISRVFATSFDEFFVLISTSVDISDAVQGIEGSEDSFGDILELTAGECPLPGTLFQITVKVFEDDSCGCRWIFNVIHRWAQEWTLLEKP